MQHARFRTGILIIAAISTVAAASARNKPKPPGAAQDQIEVLSKVTLSGGAAVRFTLTQHFSRSYLYIEHLSHELTLVDVTDPKHPMVLANLDLPASEAGAVLAAAGDAALISSEASAEKSAPAAPKERTMTIVNFADRAHPQTVRQFAKVTCSGVDDHRGLVFVANPEGLWILHRNPAEDPEVQERYAHQVLYQ
jgi:hypothetical protein